MVSSNGLVGGIKGTATDVVSSALNDGLEVVGQRNVPTVKHVPHWLRPKTPVQLAETALEQIEKFFRDTARSPKPLENILLRFYEVRGRIDSIPMWSSEFDKSDAELPEHSVVVNRDEMRNESFRDVLENKLRSVAGSFIEVLRERDNAQQDPAAALAAPPLEGSELIVVPDLDGVASVTPLREGLPTSALLQTALRIEAKLAMHFASSSVSDESYVGLWEEDGTVKFQICEVTDDTRNQWPNESVDIVALVKREDVTSESGQRDLRDNLMLVLRNNFGIDAKSAGFDVATRSTSFGDRGGQVASAPIR